MTSFYVTTDHFKLLSHMYVGWDDGEYGAPAIDCKRPYGNSRVAQDIYDMLGWPYDRDEGVSNRDPRARKIHMEMQTVLQIVLCTGSFETGRYEKTCEYDDRSWRRDES